MGYEEAGKATFSAGEDIIAEKEKVTYDLGGTVKTSKITLAIANRARQILRR